MIPIVVLHTNGFHVVNVQFCGCDRTLSASFRRHQLFRIGWFPSTHERSHSAFTIEMLEFFHEATLQGKISAHDYYQTLYNMSDNAGLLEMPVSFVVFHLLQ